MRILITGATGTIGQRLVARALASGEQVRVVGRDVARLQVAAPGAEPVGWDGVRLPPSSLEGVDVVFHLAGESVAGRWTAAHKRRVRDSRIDGTRAVVSSMKEAAYRGAFVCASAVGFYGDRGDEVLTERSDSGAGFLAEVCRAWEHEASLATALGVRVVHARTGLVLDPAGGALPAMLPAFRAGIAGRLGDGRQWMPWIHVEDVLGLLWHAARVDVQGAMNVSAPEPATNAEFTRALARVLGRPAFLPAPAFALRAVLGEMAELVLVSQRAVPEVALRTGYVFRHTDLASALAAALERPSTGHVAHA